MSFLKDVLGFEKFHLKDMGKKIKDDPKRLFVGAIDPASTKLWNKALGEDYEPLVDQMGGAYGGSTITVGDDGDGVYGRAREAGVPTKAGSQMHDVAHLISAFFAGGYGADKLGGATGMNQFTDKIPGGGKFPMPSMGGGGQQAQQAPTMPYANRAPPQPTFQAIRKPLTRQQLLTQELERSIRGYS